MGEGFTEHLKRRAFAFLEDAKVDFGRRDYDLVLFHVEQFLQLYMKHLIFKKLGDFPKTHSLIRLINNLMKVYGEEVLKKFYEDNMEILHLLEEAYITSRYLPRRYGEDIAKRALEFAERALEVLRCLE
mgnify:CR=1 FL=1